MKKNTVLIFVSFLVVLTACKKKEAAKVSPENTPTVTPPSPPDVKKEPVVTKPVQADFVKVYATHTAPEKQANDPVVVSFRTIKFVEVSISDTSDLTGGSAKLEVEVASLDSANPKRNGHLNSADLLDATKFPKANVSISDVKNAGTPDKYTAKLSVEYRGKTVAWDVKFDVVGKTDMSATVKLTHTFSMKDFAVPDLGSIADELKLEAMVKLQKAG